MHIIRLLLLSILIDIPAQIITAQQLRPGDVAPNAKVIEADFLELFNMGAAVVHKGTAFGLIDMAGNFIVPYNKYRRISMLLGVGGVSTQGGIFIVDDEMGAVNSKGKLITEAFPTFRWSVGSDDGKLIKAFEKPLYLDAEGRQYLLKQYLQHIVDGIGIVTESHKSGYKNLKDEWIVKPIYDYAEPFSEGMACVARRDEFGVIKYGFIDKTGKEVIPLIYSVKPEDFHGGLARVTPKNNSEFKQAYIDKKGNIVVKLTTFNFYSYIGNGLYYGDRGHVMDSTGKILTEYEFLQQFGVVLQPSLERNLSIGLEHSTAIANYNDGKICFTRMFKESRPQNFGSINLKTKVVMEGSFYAANSLRYFDPVSKFALATFYTSKDFKSKIPPREGYVNEQGVFVIIKGEASKW